MSPNPQVTAALGHLAAYDDADDIATYLAGRGHTGVSQADSCPVAHYLRATTGLAVHVDGDGTWAEPDEHGDTGESAWHQLPDPVAEFVGAFDDGMYPGLHPVEVDFDDLDEDVA